MKAVWYERTGAAPDVLSFGDMPTPVAGSGEVRIRLEASGVNPADAGRRAGSYRPMEFSRVIPTATAPASSIRSVTAPRGFRSVSGCGSITGSATAARLAPQRNT